MRVLMALPDPRARGGPASHLYLLANSLCGLGVQVRGFLYGGRLHNEGALRKIIGRAVDLLRLPYLILRYRPDVLHLNSAFEHKGVARDMFFIPLARTLGQRVLVKFHGSNLELLSSKHPFWRLASAVAVRSADIVCVLSNEEREAFVRRFPRTRVVVVKNALDMNRYRAAYDFRERYGIPRERTLLLFIARFIRSKGLHEVLHALPKILSRHNVHLAAVGDGPTRRDDEALARQLEITDRVTFTGHIPEDDTVAAYSSADLLVFPTYHQEGMPMVIFHSLASGLPIVTTRIRAAADWLQEDNHCLFVEARDADGLAAAVAGLLDEPERRAEMAENGRKLALQFEQNNVAKEFIAIYRSLVEGHPQLEPRHSGVMASSLLSNSTMPQRHAGAE